MTLKRSYGLTIAILLVTLVFAGIAMAQETTPDVSPTVEVTEEATTATPSAPTSTPSDFTVDPEATLDPSLVFVTPLQSTVVNIRRGAGIQNGVRGVLRPDRYLEAIGTNGFDVERTCSEFLSNDLDMWIKVRFNEGDAWVARCAVTVEGDVSLLPVAEGFEDMVITPEATSDASEVVATTEPVATAEAEATPES